jgi:hypothetical protein
VSELSLSARSFRAASRGSSVLSDKSKAGTKVSFTLTRDATVTFTVARSQPGRRAGARCVALKPGKYRLIATPSVGGQAGAPVSAAFSIAK